MAKRAEVLADLIISSDAWQYDGDFAGDPAETRMSAFGRLVVNGQSLAVVVELYQVVSADDLTAVNPVLREDVDRVTNFSGEPVKTVTLDGRIYVLVVYPRTA